MIVSQIWCHVNDPQLIPQYNVIEVGFCCLPQFVENHLHEEVRTVCWFVG